MESYLHNYTNKIAHRHTQIKLSKGTVGTAQGFGVAGMAVRIGHVTFEIKCYVALAPTVPRSATNCQQEEKEKKNKIVIKTVFCDKIK